MCTCVCVFVVPLIILVYLVWKLYKSGIFDNVEVQCCLLAATICITFCYLSVLLYSLLVSVSDSPPFVDKSLTVYYKHHIGSYKKVGKYLDRAKSLMPDGVVAFGIYYDNPNVITGLICHLSIGVDGKDLYDEEYGSILKEAGYEKLVLPAVEKAVVATQKYYLLVFCDALFFLIRLQHRIQFRFAVEFYYGKKIHVVLPLDHQTDFIVRELMSLEELEKKLAENGSDSDSSSDSDIDDDDTDVESDNQNVEAEASSGLSQQPVDKKNE
uniref:Testis-expressed sequence 264 protein n=1 Tax=Syphacia muris TaxID=451379 RepID=A0A0N5A9S5_9BILA